MDCQKIDEIKFVDPNGSLTISILTITKILVHRACNLNLKLFIRSIAVFIILD